MKYILKYFLILVIVFSCSEKSFYNNFSFDIAVKSIDYKLTMDSLVVEKRVYGSGIYDPNKKEEKYLLLDVNDKETLLEKLNNFYPDTLHPLYINPGWAHGDHLFFDFKSDEKNKFIETSYYYVPELDSFVEFINSILNKNGLEGDTIYYPTPKEAFEDDGLDWLSPDIDERIINGGKPFQE